MNIDKFWDIIERGKKRFDPDRSEGNMSDFVEDLERILLAFPPGEVISFRDHFEDLMRESYDLDLWAAAFLIAQGCSDDSFTDFRCWLIFMGRQAFEDALANPDSLIGPTCAPGVEVFFFEELYSIPDEVYESLTGEQSPDYPGPDYPFPPKKGTRRRDDESDLPHRFPLLWAKYGEENAG